RGLLLVAAVTRPGAGVVRHVPARALQVEARAGDESLDLPPALRAPLERRIGDALHLLEDAALLAAVLVDRHDGRLIMPRRRVNGKRRTQPGPDRRGIEALDTDPLVAAAGAGRDRDGRGPHGECAGEHGHELAVRRSLDRRGR